MLFPLHIKKVGITAWSQGWGGRLQCCRGEKHWQRTNLFNLVPVPMCSSLEHWQSPAKAAVNPSAVEHQGYSSVGFLEGTCFSSPTFQHVPAAAFPEHGQLGIAVPKNPCRNCLKVKAIKVKNRNKVSKRHFNLLSTWENYYRSCGLFLRMWEGDIPPFWSLLRLGANCSWLHQVLDEMHHFPVLLMYSQTTDILLCSSELADTGKYPVV